jgi:hypothetical protein
VIVRPASRPSGDLALCGDLLVSQRVSQRQGPSLTEAFSCRRSVGACRLNKWFAGFLPSTELGGIARDLRSRKVLTSKLSDRYPRLFRRAGCPPPRPRCEAQKLVCFPDACVVLQELVQSVHRVLWVRRPVAYRCPPVRVPTTCGRPFRRWRLPEVCTEEVPGPLAIAPVVRVVKSHALSMTQSKTSTQVSDRLLVVFFRKRWRQLRDYF